MNTSNKPWNKDYFNHLPLLPLWAASFTWPKRMEACSHAMTTGLSMINHQVPLYSTPEQLRGARIFSKLDLHSANNLIQIRKDDEWKTAFLTPSGHYEFRIMPYRLANSPSVFQAFMDELFRDMLQQFIIIYINDILMYSRNLAEHRRHVAQVL